MSCAPTRVIVEAVMMAQQRQAKHCIMLVTEVVIGLARAPFCHTVLYQRTPVAPNPQTIWSCRMLMQPQPDLAFLKWQMIGRRPKFCKYMVTQEKPNCFSVNGC